MSLKIDGIFQSVLGPWMANTSQLNNQKIVARITLITKAHLALSFLALVDANYKFIYVDVGLQKNSRHVEFPKLVPISCN